MNLDDQRAHGAQGGRATAARRSPQQRRDATERARAVKDILSGLGRDRKPSTNPWMFEYPVRVQR